MHIDCFYFSVTSNPSPAVLFSAVRMVNYGMNHFEFNIFLSE